MTTAKGITKDDGSEWWYRNEEMRELHRKDGPAYIHPNGNKQWWLYGKLHREDGPAVVSAFNGGVQQWYVNGIRHRIDGPAIIYYGTSERWYINNKDITEYVESFMQKYNVKSVEEMNEEIQCLFWIFLGTL